MEKPLSKKVLWAVIFTVFIDMIGFGILIPVIPQLLANPTSEFFLLPKGWSVDRGYIMLGFLMAIFPFMQFIATPILGELSDRYGRKPILAISLVGTCISYILFAVGIILRNIPLLFVARAFDGITGGNIAVAQAAIADVSAPESRAKNFGLIGGAFGLGFILGPFIGGKLSDPNLLSWFSAATPFWFAAFLSLLNALSVIVLLPETIKEKSKDITLHWLKSFRNISKALHIEGMHVLFSAGFLFQAGFSFFTTFFSVFLISRFSFDQGEIGNYFAYVGIWIALSQALITRNVNKKLTERTVLRFSFILTGVFILLEFIPHGWIGLLIVTPFFAIFNGLSQANLTGLVSRSAPDTVQGEILGINASVQAMAQFIPPALSGFIAAALTPQTPILISGATIILAGIVFILFFKQRAKIIPQAASV